MMRAVLVLVALCGLLAAALLPDQLWLRPCAPEPGFSPDAIRGVVTDDIRLQHSPAFRLTGMEETLRTHQMIRYRLDRRDTGIKIHLFTPEEGWDYLRVTTDLGVVPFTLDAADRLCAGRQRGGCEVIWRHGVWDFAMRETREESAAELDHPLFSETLRVVSDQRRLEIYVSSPDPHRSACAMNATLQAILDR